MDICERARFRDNLFTASQRLDKYARRVEPCCAAPFAQRQQSPGAAPTSALLDTGAANLVLIAGYSQQIGES